MTEPMSGASAPDAAAEASNGARHVHIARQPLVDRKQKIVGYELLARESATSTAAPLPLAGNADSVMLFNALSEVGSENLFGDKLAFVNVQLSELGGDHFDLVQPERVILELPRVPVDDPERIAQAAEHIQRLAEQGFRFAGGAFTATAAYKAWLPFIRFLKIDARSLPAAALPALIRKLESLSGVQLVAEKVETHEAFQSYLTAGFHLFQGYYFARPQTVTVKALTPAYTTVLRLIDQVNKQAEIAELEETLKGDPALSYKLLRYINSSGFGLMTEITSFRHAILILGYKKLFRWLVLLLVTTPSHSAASALALNALTRGRMMEILARHSMPDEFADHAFVTGVFSMLDVMLGTTLEEALGPLALPETVSLALQQEAGPLGPYLHIARACETDLDSGLEETAALLGLTEHQVAMAHLEALAWAENLGI